MRYENQINENTRLNEAILTVLTTQYKKDAPEAFNRVKEAGYEYVKSNGRFEVVKPQTQPGALRKWVSLGDIHTGGRRNKQDEYERYTYRELSTSNGYSKVEEKNIRKINFVGILETPVNVEWRDLQYTNYWPNDKSAAVRTYENKIRSPRHMAQSYEENIKAYQKQIQDLQNKMLQAMERKIEYENEVVVNKKELGLA